MPPPIEPKHLACNEYEGVYSYWCTASGYLPNEYTEDPSKATCIDCLTTAADFGKQAQTRLAQIRPFPEFVVSPAEATSIITKIRRPKP